MPPPRITSARLKNSCSAMISLSARRRVCATIAAGVASCSSASETMPTPILVLRLTSSAMVSTLGCARLLAAREAYTPSALTLDLWPVVYALIALAESVISESTPEVPISAVLGMSSNESMPRYLPSVMPRDSTRAAVRLAMVMPSPMNRITFLARRGPVA